MSLQIIDSVLNGVLLIEPRVFSDDRGFFLETFHRQKYREAGIDQNFVQVNHSHSVRGVLRGLHYQLRQPQGKLLYVVSGEIFDVAVDNRRGSPTFGQWYGAVLSAENKRQLFVPEGFAHGFYVTSAEADVIYNCTDLYLPGDEYSLLWSDTHIGIDWPLDGEPLLSDKDRQCAGLHDIAESRLPVYDQ